MPNEVLDQWRATLESLTREQVEYEIRLRIEDYLDRGRGPCLLKNQAIAKLVQRALLHFDAQRYHLHAWVVMPNHVHMLFSPLEGFPVPRIMHALKSFTAKKANRLLRTQGRFWQEDYFDRYIRSEKHYHKTVKYIEMNPVKAGLCDNKEAWEFSSAFQGPEHGLGGRDARAPRP